MADDRSLPTEARGEGSRFFCPETFRRLQAVKADYDPGSLFQANHTIPPAR